MTRNYYRAFLALRQERSEYSIQGREALGRCIIEARGREGRISCFVQDLKAGVKYKLYIIAASSGASYGTCAGTVYIDARGKSDMRFDIDADDVMKTGLPIESFNVAAIVAGAENEMVTPLIGFKNNMPVMWRMNFSFLPKPNENTADKPKIEPKIEPKHEPKHEPNQEPKPKQETPPKPKIKFAENETIQPPPVTTAVLGLEETETISGSIAVEASGQENKVEIEAVEAFSEKIAIETEIEPKIAVEPEPETKVETGDIENIIEAEFEAEFEALHKQPPEPLPLHEEAEHENLEYAAVAEEPARISLEVEATHVEAMRGETEFQEPEKPEQEIVQNNLQNELEAKASYEQHKAQHSEVLAEEFHAEVEEVKCEEPANGLKFIKIETDNKIDKDDKIDKIDGKGGKNKSKADPQPEKPVSDEAHKLFQAMARKFNEEMEELSKFAFKPDTIHEPAPQATNDNANANAKAKENKTSFANLSQNNDINLIFAENTKMKPFAKQRADIVWVRTSPSEFPAFPFNYSEYINHPFIISAYKNFKHLIIGKTAIDGETKYVLGVPDVFCEENREVATGLGFRQFKSCSGEPGECGHGYWLLVLGM